MTFRRSLLRVMILGTGTLVPAPEHGTSGLVVTAGKDNLLFDGGSGTLYRASRLGLDWREMAHIFYTHYHPDHSLDLVSILFASNYAPPEGRGDDLKIYGPEGLKDFFAAVSRAWPSVVPKKYNLYLRELTSGESVEGGAGWKVFAAQASHGDALALAYRVTDSRRSVVYSGDTEYSVALAELAQGADLIICECSTDDAHKAPGHLSPSGIARIVEESGVERVLLTHVYPPFNPEELALQCRRMCGASVEAARDMSIYKI